MVPKWPAHCEKGSMSLERKHIEELQSMSPFLREEVWARVLNASRRLETEFCGSPAHCSICSNPSQKMAQSPYARFVVQSQVDHFLKMHLCDKHMVRFLIRNIIEYRRPVAD